MLNNNSGIAILIRQYRCFCWILVTMLLVLNESVNSSK